MSSSKRFKNLIVHNQGFSKYTCLKINLETGEAMSLKHFDVNLLLTHYTEKEKLYCKGDLFFDDRVYQKYEETFEEDGTSSKTYLFEDHSFLSSYESIGVYKQDRFQPVPPHRHNYIELLYVWSGSCSQTINGQRIECIQGDVCILDTKTTHSVDEAGEKDIIVNILMRKEFFASTFLNRMTRQGILAEFLINAVTQGHEKQRYLFFRTLGNSKFHDCMQDTLREYYSNDIGKREVMESYMIIMFTELLRIYRQNPVDHHRLSKPSNMKLLDVLEYIENNYEKEQCSLKSVAEHFKLNEKYLTMLLKKKTGRSFVEHLQEQKLNKAKMLLLNSDLPITEVIALCGYNNTNFFYKKFKMSEGCTPAEYRDKRRNQHT
jgi:AraC-like DNA-binding protein/quercetin dioxygenase-like cupin family protein